MDEADAWSWEEAGLAVRAAEIRAVFDDLVATFGLGEAETHEQSA